MNETAEQFMKSHCEEDSVIFKEKTIFISYTVINV